MKKIGVIGESLIDKYGDKEQIGGAALNAACSLAAQGNEVHFLGAISNDARGKRIKATFEKYGVKLDYVEFTDVPTTYSEVTLDRHNERSFTFNRGSDAEYDISKFESKGFDFDFVHFGSATGLLKGKLNASYLYLREYCVKHDIPYGFDPNYRNALVDAGYLPHFIDQCLTFVKQATLAKISDNEVRLIFKTSKMDEAVKKLGLALQKNSLGCVTCGGDNTIAIFNEQSWVVAVKKVKPADTTGAGDAFASRIVDLITNNTKPLTKELLTMLVTSANEYAAKAVEYIGALTYLSKK